MALDAPAAVRAGEVATWTVTVRNDGPSDAAGATAGLDLPPGLLGLTAVVDGGAACPVTAEGVRCALGVLPAGEQRVVTVSGRLDPASLATDLPVRASAGSTTPDPDDADLTATAGTAVSRAADLALTKVVEGPVVAGRTVTWSLAVTNPGPSTARDVVLADVLPAGVLDPVVTSGDAECALVDGTLRCTRDQLAPGGTVQVRLTRHPRPGLRRRRVRNTATATTSTPDPVPGGGSATTRRRRSAPPPTSAWARRITSGPPGRRVRRSPSRWSSPTTGLRRDRTSCSPTPCPARCGR